MTQLAAPMGDKVVAKSTEASHPLERLIQQHEVFSPRGWCRAYSARLWLRRPESLNQGALCLCRCPLLPSERLVASLLTSEEFAYYAGVSSEKRKQSFLIGRYAAKKAVSLVSNEKPEDIRIHYGVFKNPLISNSSTQGERLEISISHASEIGAALVFPSAHQMGIDIEKVDAAKAKVIEKEMTRKELDTLNEWSALDYNSILTMAWTIKESLSKSLRTGLMTPFSLFEISRVSARGGLIESTFLNFPQYKSISFKMDDFFVSLTCPKRTEMEIDVQKIFKGLFTDDVS